MLKIELQPIREWEEKDGNKPTGNIRIYIGGLHAGTCRRKNKTEELYSFDSLDYSITHKMDSSTYRPLEDIKTDVELCFKEFAKKWLKTFKTLTLKQSTK